MNPLHYFQTAILINEFTAGVTAIHLYLAQHDIVYLHGW